MEEVARCAGRGEGRRDLPGDDPRLADPGDDDIPAARLETANGSDECPVEPLGSVDDRPGFRMEYATTTVDDPVTVGRSIAGKESIGPCLLASRFRVPARRRIGWIAAAAAGRWTTFEEAERVSERHDDRPARGPTATPSGRSPGSWRPWGAGG
jgi:hypothetical protein